MHDYPFSSAKIALFFDICKLVEGNVCVCVCVCVCKDSKVSKDIKDNKRKKRHCY